MANLGSVESRGRRYRREAREAKAKSVKRNVAARKKSSGRGATPREQEILDEYRAREAFEADKKFVELENKAREVALSKGVQTRSQQIMMASGGDPRRLFHKYDVVLTKRGAEFRPKFSQEKKTDVMSLYPEARVEPEARMRSVEALGRGARREFVTAKEAREKGVMNIYKDQATLLIESPTRPRYEFKGTPVGGKQYDKSGMVSATDNRSRSSVSDSRYNLSKEKETERRYEQAIKELTEKESKFFESEGFKNIDKFSENILPSYKLTPKFEQKKDDFVPSLVLEKSYVEEPSWMTKYAREIVSGTLKAPVAIPGSIYFTGGKLAAVGTGLLAVPRSREKIGKELFVDAPKKTLQVLNPTTPSGAAAFTFAALGAFGGAKSPAIQRTNPIKVETVKVATDVPFANKIDFSKTKIEPLGGKKSAYPSNKMNLLDTPDVSYASTVKVTSLGLGLGTRAQPIVSFGYEGIKLGLPKFQSRIPASSLSEAQGIPQPMGALGGKTFKKLIDFTPLEEARISKVVESGRILGKDKGLPVKDFVAGVEGLKSPGKATKVVEGFTKGGDGVYFGSLTTKQLPKGYQTLSPGDVDVIFPKLTVEQIRPRISKATKELQMIGENVEVSPRGDNIIQFRSGEKFLEAKSGINQEMLGLGDEAPAGYLGLEFPDLKHGRIAKTVPFGEARAITAGEQFLRKGAGATIVSPGKGLGETPSFSQPGLLGKQVNPRGLKDVAGFFQSGKGLVDIRSQSINPFKRSKGTKAGRALDDAFGTYSVEQRADILTKLEATTGTDFRVPLSPGRTPKSGLGGVPSGSLVYSPKLLGTTGSKEFFSMETPKKSIVTERVSAFRSGSPRSLGRVSPSFGSIGASRVPSSFFSSPSPRSRSPGRSRSPSPRPSKSMSPFVSPSKSVVPSKSPSPFPSKYISPSPSPSISPRSFFSPRSPYSPSPFITSPPSPPPSWAGRLFLPRSRGGKQFEVFSVQRGAVINLGGFGTAKEAALFGKQRVGTSAKRSVKVKKKGLGAIDISKFLGGDYKPSKSRPGFFVEPSKKAINTFGELSEITHKSGKRKRRGMI